MFLLFGDCIRWREVLLEGDIQSALAPAFRQQVPSTKEASSFLLTTVTTFPAQHFLH